MSTIREVLERIEVNKRERKKLKDMMKEALEQNGPWVKAHDEVVQEKARLKQIEVSVLSDYKSEVDELEKLNLEIKNDTEVLSDMALTLFMKGQNIDVETDTKKYAPKISVSFKQLKLL